MDSTHKKVGKSIAKNFGKRKYNAPVTPLQRRRTLFLQEMMIDIPQEKTGIGARKQKKRKPDYFLSEEPIPPL